MVEKPQAPVSPSTDDHLRAVVKSYFSTSKEPTTNTEEVNEGLEKDVDAALGQMETTLRKSALYDKDMEWDDILKGIDATKAEADDIIATLESDRSTIGQTIEEWLASPCPRTQEKGLMLCVRALLERESTSSPSFLQKIYDSRLAERIVLLGLDCAEYRWLAGFLLRTEDEHPVKRAAAAATGGLSQKDLQALRTALAEMEGAPAMVHFGDPKRVGSLRRAVSTREGVKALARGKCSVGLALLCIEQRNRSMVAQWGLSVLMKGMDASEAEGFGDTAVLCRQATCQIGASVDPRSLTYTQCTTIAVACLKQITVATNGLEEFEATLALSRITSASSELREFVAEKKAWETVRELIFNKDERIKTVATEVWCNLCSTREIQSRFMASTASAQEDLKILTALSFAESLKTRIAATGAIANLLVSDDQDEDFPIVRMAVRNEMTVAMISRVVLDEHEDIGVRYRAATAAQAIIASGVDDSCETLTAVLREYKVADEKADDDAVARSMKELIHETLALFDS